MADKVRLALVGTGIFSEIAHLPAIEALSDKIDLVAVCSRRKESAERFAGLVKHPVEVFTDYDALLARSDIDAVDLVLPISVFPSAIEAALNAGKHVVSEKPAAPDVASGRKLLAVPRKSIWMVAENWRYDKAIARAAEIIASGQIGKPILFHWGLHIAAYKGQYFKTEWRRDNSFPGGYLLDGGVHHMAGIRALLGEVSDIAAFAAEVRPDIPPHDTIAATMHFDSGCIGTYTITYSGDSPYEELLTIVGEKGALKVGFQKVDVSGVPDVTGEIIQSFKMNTIQAELENFADAILNGATLIATPEQAVQDVALLEAILKSAETGQVVKPERIV
jgi:predicted dehydrogenase